MTKLDNDKYLYHSGNVGRDDGLTSVWFSFQERNGNGDKTHYFSAPFDTYRQPFTRCESLESHCKSDRRGFREMTTIKTIQEMYSMMESCNGEIRVKPGRYGGGWLAAGCCCVEWEFDQQWEDLTSGDMEYFDAVDFFKRNKDVVLIQYASSPQEAFKSCENVLRFCRSE